MAKESISFRLESEKKEQLYSICENNNVNVADILRNYIDMILENKNTVLKTINNNEKDLKFIIQEIKENNDNIIKILKFQLEEKDKQLNQKNKLIENMQILMKDNQQLLKDEQNKNILLLDNKNKTNWFPFFNKRKNNL